MASQSNNLNKRSGAALLVVIFTVFMVSSLVLNMLDTETQQVAVARNVRDYERALYLANAGVHHACAVLNQSPAFRGTVSEGAYPGEDTYSATIVDGAVGQIDVTSIGVAGEATRTVQAILDF